MFLCLLCDLFYLDPDSPDGGGLLAEDGDGAGDRLADVEDGGVAVVGDHDVVDAVLERGDRHLGGKSERI